MPLCSITRPDDGLPGRQRIRAEVQLRHGLFVCGAKALRDIRFQLQGPALGETAGGRISTVSPGFVKWANVVSATSLRIRSTSSRSASRSRTDWSASSGYPRVGHCARVAGGIDPRPSLRAVGEEVLLHLVGVLGDRPLMWVSRVICGEQPQGEGAQE